MQVEAEEEEEEEEAAPERKPAGKKRKDKSKSKRDISFADRPDEEEAEEEAAAAPAGVGAALHPMPLSSQMPARSHSLHADVLHADQATCGRLCGPSTLANACLSAVQWQTEEEPAANGAAESGRADSDGEDGLQLDGARKPNKKAKKGKKGDFVIPDDLDADESEVRSKPHARNPAFQAPVPAYFDLHFLFVFGAVELGSSWCACSMPHAIFFFATGAADGTKD